MKTQWITKKIKYDGSQLSPLYAYLNHRLLGNSIIGFVGPCDIPFQHMVDGEDLIDEAKICGQEMLHFIVEIFSANTMVAVSLQRLLAQMFLEILRERLPGKQRNLLRRDGDDIYYGTGKLSISIASSSVHSSMIHFAVNITNKGTPVPTSSLGDMKIETKSLALDVMKSFAAEFASIQIATQKVRPL